MSICWTMVTCTRCGQTGQCTPSNDYYLTDLWDEGERVCESCFAVLIENTKASL